MKYMRMIKLASVATVVGSAAILLAISKPALATTCGFAYVCFGYPVCSSMTQAQLNSDCLGQQPPGCTLELASCIPDVPCTGGGGLQCHYH